MSIFIYIAVKFEKKVAVCSRLLEQFIDFNFGDKVLGFLPVFALCLKTKLCSPSLFSSLMCVMTSLARDMGDNSSKS